MFHVKHARKNRKEGILVRFHKKSILKQLFISNIPKHNKKSLKYVDKFVDKLWVRWVQHTLSKIPKKYTKYILDLSQKLIFYNILILNKL